MEGGNLEAGIEQEGVEGGNLEVGIEREGVERGNLEERIKGEGIEGKGWGRQEGVCVLFLLVT